LERKKNGDVKAKKENLKKTPGTGPNSTRRDEGKAGATKENYET